MPVVVNVTLWAWMVTSVVLALAAVGALLVGALYAGLWLRRVWRRERCWRRFDKGQR